MPDDFTKEAEALFTRFAGRHCLCYDVETQVPIEVCWTFPVQEKLSIPLTLGLQNGDELNFGVSDFWSYFFPFEKVSDHFASILDAWVAGDARVAVMRGRGRRLEIREKEGWQSVYGANGCLFPFRRSPVSYVQNQPGQPNE